MPDPPSPPGGSAAGTFQRPQGTPSHRWGQALPPQTRSDALRFPVFTRVEIAHTPWARQKATYSTDKGQVTVSGHGAH